MVILRISPCEAEPDTQAKAHVFARETREGARLVFDWDMHEKVPFTIENMGKHIVLHFDDPVSLHWGTSIKAVRRSIRKVESQDDGTTIILTLNEASQAHYYQDDSAEAVENERSGIDILRGNDSDVAFERPRQQTATHTRPRVLVHAAPKKKIREAKSRIPQPLLQQDIASIVALSPAAGTPVTVPSEPPSSVNTAAVATIQNKQVPAVTLPLSSASDAYAVFVWQKNLWIITNSVSPPSEDDLRKAGAPLITDIKTIPNPHATIYYMPLAQDVSASVATSSAGRLQIVLEHNHPRLAHELVPEIKTSAANENSLLIPTDKAMPPVSFINPFTGDAMDVIPSPEPGAGIAQPYSFVQFTVLPSAQGIAIDRTSDKIAVSAQKDGIEVAMAGGLAISPQAAQQLEEMRSEMMLAGLPSTLFPYARWKLEDEKNFVPAQIKLLHDITFSAPDAANKARLKLLGLFLSEGLFPEALGMANDILRGSLKFYQDNKVSALRGAAYLFMYRIGDAERDFSVPELKNDPEAAMWLTLCKELLGESLNSFNFSANYDRYIQYYPPPFIGKLAIIAADRSINRKQYADATAIFEELKDKNYDAQVKKYIDYMRAKIFSETHEEGEAIKIWEEQAKDLGDPLIRARAEFSLINLQLKDDKISHAEAIKRLEKLRIVWRGDSLELNVLTLLSNLYLQDKQYSNALYTMRDIVLYYPEMPEAITTAKQMENIFVTLYSKHEADTMPPLDALTLFYEFRDLVPLGSSGDEMVRNLADRLVNIDLLDRAAQLLDHQIRNRLEGDSRSRIGTQLAHIYLLNHQPEKALDVLKTTGYGELSPDLLAKRLRLTAQALAQQGHPDKAIDVIRADNSAEGILLRLSIYWDNKDWSNLVPVAEDYLGNRSDPSAMLNDTESDVLLKLATAYVYEHETGQLEYLRDYFTPLMKNNPRRDSFLFITGESGTVNYDNLAALDQEMGKVKAFITSSEDKPGKNGLSK